MKVSAALLDAARTRSAAAIDIVNTFSHSTFAGQALVSRPGHAGCTARNRALMRRLQAGAAEANLFLTDFRSAIAIAAASRRRRACAAR